MTLSGGSSLGPYKITREIGRGAMGVVFLAHDGRLDRDVAIKALPEYLTDAPERLARFEREGKSLAQLNHPNVAGIHGVEERDAQKFLVLEYVEGETLGELLRAGPIPIKEALDLATQIAAGLQAAHEVGVIHRDLKPDNVKITPAGHAKVLDFGLAKSSKPKSGTVGGWETPTMSSPKQNPTIEGTILGTTPYMSPEQARGKPVDKRTDIWAFGCVLYEMLTGKRAFDGETMSDCMAAVLTSEPDFDSLPPTTTGLLRRLVHRCLQKDQQRRWQDIGDVRIELEELAAGKEEQQGVQTVATGASRSPASLFVRYAPWMVALAALAIAFTMYLQNWFAPSENRSTVRMMIVPAPGVTLQPRYATVAVPSPDGSHIVYVGVSEGRQQLWLRKLDELTARVLPGTDDGWQPFFSPDGTWVGFFADRKLKRVPLAGGPTETIVEIGNNPRGASWGADGWIVVAPTQTSGLIRVNADDGEIESLTELDIEQSESTHRWPQVLPQGRGVLFTARAEGTSFDRANIVIDPLDGAEPKVVVAGAAHGRYIHNGHIVFVRGGGVFAVPFDLQQLQTIGEPVRVIDGVIYNRRNGGAQFAISENGTLVYRPGAALASDSTPMWVDRAGVTEPIDDTQRAYSEPRASPDGSRLLVSIFDGRASKLWTLDVTRGTFSQITNRDSLGGRWVDAKGKFVVYAAGKTSQLSLFLCRTDGLGQPRPLTETRHRQVPCTASPDGRFVVYQVRRPETGWDLMMLELDSDGAPVGQPRALLATPSNEENAHLSRDGKFLAYESDEMDGVVQIYVRSFPNMENKLQISARGARQPRFSRTKDEVCFWSTGLQQFRGVKYKNESGTFFAEPTERLLATTKFSASAGGDGGVLADPSFLGYDVDPNSDRFVMLELEKVVAPAHEGEMVVVLDWFTELNNKLKSR